MSIMDKLKKNSKIKESSVLADSKFFTEKDMIPTPVPMINVALSGSIDGGLTPGLTVLAGPSKHFKTSFALIMASASSPMGGSRFHVPDRPGCTQKGEIENPLYF